MKILYVTNLPAPYRIDYFNSLSCECELSVAFERKNASNRNEKWVNPAEKKFDIYEINGLKWGEERSFSFKIINILRKKKYDKIVYCGYSSPTVLIGMIYCIRKSMEYYIESDGGFDKYDNKILHFIKKFFLKHSKGVFTTCEQEISYFKRYGLEQSKICKYPFTSIQDKDIVSKPFTNEMKKNIRERLGIQGEKIVVSVGRFTYGKGFDVLIGTKKYLPEDIHIYIIGDEVTEEFLDLIRKYNVKNIHFVGFMTKKQLDDYYAAADLFVLPTRKDVWGLVINEAMAKGLPVISTENCIAALELIKNNQNGYIVPCDNEKILAEKIEKIMSNSLLRNRMAECSLDIIKDYTIKKMVDVHSFYFGLREDK